MRRHLAAILAADVAGYSQIMADDEAATLTALKSCLSDVVEPCVGQHYGRVFKTMGDGFLAEFPSVVEAVACAGDIQHAMAARNLRAGTLQLLFRIGVHLGDVMAEGDDVFGDGVNVAARLQSLAEAGGVRISRQAYDQVEGKLGVAYRSLGEQRLKNIPRPIGVYAAEFGGDGTGVAAPALKQEIKYCRAPDGTRLAYATVGKGPVLVKAANWLNHLELDWESPAWGPLMMGLAREHTLIRYDDRGAGMSDWDVDNISFDAWVSDFESVVEASGVGRFALLGMSQGCSIAIAYAVRHPKRVSHLILYGGHAVGWKHRALTAEQLEKAAAMRTLARMGWDADNPAFRQMFTTQFMPDATKEQADSFNELQRRAASLEGLARFFEAASEVNVSGLLEQVRTPTLVLHVRDDAVVPIEFGRRMAAGISRARFVAMPGRNHIPLPSDPALSRFLEEVRLFVS
jgi:class 3 adenylate cyclase/pimeloyl-ACP methyl ester carboxylesterase